MKLSNKILILIIIGFISCKKTVVIKEPKVVSGNDKTAYNALKKMNLDSTYTNLLDPRNVTADEYKLVAASWSGFHKKLSHFIKEENFKWEVPDSTITIMNRIYFDKNGTIDYYTFKIKNSSVTDEKIVEYKKVLQKFSENVKLDLKRTKNYAQCGKITYKNL
ncbi:hypothetical protein N9K49_01270 [Flavobacteriaceae bacterium]|nr:hypothetical protein [Flavobacteriaceae bacterium]